MIPQLNEALLGAIRQQEGVVVQDDSAVRQFNGFHKDVSTSILWQFPA
jgi:hypothetical protein